LRFLIFGVLVVYALVHYTVVYALEYIGKLYRISFHYSTIPFHCSNTPIIIKPYAYNNLSVNPTALLYGNTVVYSETANFIADTAKQIPEDVATHPFVSLCSKELSQVLRFLPFQISISH